MCWSGRLHLYKAHRQHFIQIFLKCCCRFVSRCRQTFLFCFVFCRCCFVALTVSLLRVENVIIAVYTSLQCREVGTIIILMNLLLYTYLRVCIRPAVRLPLIQVKLWVECKLLLTVSDTLLYTSVYGCYYDCKQVHILCFLVFLKYVAVLV